MKENRERIREASRFARRKFYQQAHYRKRGVGNDPICREVRANRLSECKDLANELRRRAGLIKDGNHEEMKLYKQQRDKKAQEYKKELQAQIDYHRKEEENERLN